MFSAKIYLKLHYTGWLSNIHEGIKSAYNLFSDMPIYLYYISLWVKQTTRDTLYKTGKIHRLCRPDIHEFCVTRTLSIKLPFI